MERGIVYPTFHSTLPIRGTSWDVQASNTWRRGSTPRPRAPWLPSGGYPSSWVGVVRTGYLTAYQWKLGQRLKPTIPVEGSRL